MEQQQKFKLLQIFCTLFAINILCLLPDRCLVPVDELESVMTMKIELFNQLSEYWIDLKIVLGLYHFSQFFQKTKFEEKIGWLLTYGYV